MTRFLIVLGLAAFLVGCASSDRPAESPAAAQTAQGEAKVDAAPALISELTDQTKVYECPKCGMMFDAAGTCSMGCAELVETDVAYICPADDKPVAKAGTCERCPMNARVVKTTVAMAEPQDAPPATTGN